MLMAVPRWVAQLAEQRSPKPQVAGSIPVPPASMKRDKAAAARKFAGEWQSDKGDMRTGKGTPDGAERGRRAEQITQAQRTHDGDARGPMRKRGQYLV